MTNAQRVYLASIVGTFDEQSNAYLVEYIKGTDVVVYVDGTVAHKERNKPFKKEQLTCFDRDLINQVTDEFKFMEGVINDAKQSTTSNVR